jgi:hypothetical protein
MAAENRALANMRERSRGYFLPRRHTPLLVPIVTTIVVRLLVGDGGNGPAVFSIAMLALMLVSLFTIHIDWLTGGRKMLLAERRRCSIVGWSLAVRAIADRLIVIVVPSQSFYLTLTTTRVNDHNR